MDTKSHLKMIMDSLNEQCDLLMVSMHREPSGSILIKARYKEAQNGGLCGSGATQNDSLYDSLYLKRKNTKQITRDLNRAKQNHTHSSLSRNYGLRSKMSMPAEIEKPRLEEVSPEENLSASPHEVTSPAETVVSPDPFEANSPAFQLGCSPDLPQMREPANQAPDQACEESASIMSSEAEEAAEIISDLDPDTPPVEASQNDMLLDPEAHQKCSNDVTVVREPESISATYSADSFSDDFWEKARLAMRAGLRGAEERSNKHSSTKEPDG